MPLWLDLLRTPMAAPETPKLRRMRFIWQGLCLTTATGAGLFGPIHRAVGRGASIAMVVLVFACVFWTVFYLMRKQRADRAFLEALVEIE
jgi:4-hydroxybenzoate polyprenyltransferase